MKYTLVYWSVFVAIVFGYYLGKGDTYPLVLGVWGFNVVFSSINVVIFLPKIKG